MNSLPPTFQPSRGVIHLGTALTVIGGLTLVCGLLVIPKQTWGNVLLASYYLLGLGLGGIVFVAFQYVMGAGWGVAFRRLPEALAALIPVASAGILVVLLAYPKLYPWTEHASANAEPSAAFRHLWLNRPFVLFRAIVYMALWILFASTIVRISVKQDEDGKVGHTYANQRWSAMFLVVFGLTCWLSSVDWIMSLEPEWSSTIFGVYHFSGLFLGGLAVVAVLAVGLWQQGALRGVLSTDHLHDLGTLLFSFSNFWMYIWISQFLLIWYVNFPEETSHYIRRLHNGWQWPFYLNVVLNWGVPFLVLLPKAAKQSPRVLLGVSLVILIGRWLDVYLMILPSLGGGPMQGIGIVECGLAAGAVGVFLVVVLRTLGTRSLVPINDPNLVESLPHQDRVGHREPSAGDLSGQGQGLFTAESRG